MKTFIYTYLKRLNLLLILCLIAGFAYAQEPTEFVTIDGFKYHVKMGGMEHLKDSIPIVVLEMGAGSSLQSWDPIFNDLTKIAPVFAYERAGIGQSEWNNIEPSPINVANQLKKILMAVELEPPYILAGHSWGGVIIRTYAGQFKGDVKALIYIDPMDYEMTTEDEKSIFRNIGADPDESLKFVEDVTNFFTSGQELPPGITAEYRAIEKFNKLPLEKRELGPEPNLPLIVFIGTKLRPEPPVPPQFEKPFDYKDWADAATKHRIESLSHWPYEYSDEGYLSISPIATHFFHFGEPKMVVDMISRFVEK